MKTIDFTKIYKKYKGQWVVFDKNDSVVTADKDFKKAIAKFKEKYPKAIPDVFKVPTKIVPYIGPT